MQVSRRIFVGLALAAVSGCGGRTPNAFRSSANFNPPLFPNETAELRQQINYWADTYEIPRTLLHRVIQRESDYRPEARNGPYYGLLQILPQTARTMGHRGEASELLKAEVNLQYAGKYLRGAWLVADGSETKAIEWYAKGYYYEAKRRGLLVKTGLRSA